MTQIRTAYIYTGLPGAGKSTAVDISHEIAGGTVNRSGDVVRQMAADEGIENPESQELADFAARKRETLGNSFFADKLTSWIHTGRMNPEYPLHIDGVRHIDSVKKFRQFFDIVPLILVTAPDELRLERLNERGREGEGEFDMEQLAHRDMIEKQGLGQETIMSSGSINFTVKNDGTLDELTAEIASIVSTVQEQEEIISNND